MIRIHFLNVGNGDCCIIEFIDNSRVAIVDINRSTEMDKESSKEIYKILRPSSQYLFELGFNRINKEMLENAGYDIPLQDPLEYLSKNNINGIFRFISTHPHMDHLSGLYELKKQFGFANIWIIKNNYEQDLTDLSESQKRDWDLYRKMRNTSERTIDNTTIISPGEGNQNHYYKEDGIHILAPNKELKEGSDENANRISYVLLVIHKERKIILASDAEQETWEYLVENHSSAIENIDILKAAHHGRSNGYYQPAVKLMSPTVTIVSVGKKPDSDASNKYRQYSDYVWSTRWKGNIVLEINDEGKITSQTQFNR